MRVRWIAGFAGVSLLLAACSGGGTSGQGTPVPRPRSTATISILEPQPGATAQGGQVNVRLELKGGTITTVVSTDLQPNVGHIHLRLDGRTITLLGSLDETVPNVSPGQHVLEAEFVAVDHGPFDPRVISTVTFTMS